MAQTMAREGKPHRDEAMVPLPMQPADATPLSDCLSVRTHEGITTWYCYLQPICAHAADDRQAGRRAAAQFVVLGLAQVSRMAEALGVNRKVISRAVRLYRDEGDRGFFKPPRPRPRTAIDSSQRAEAARLHAGGMSIAAVARELGIASSTLYRYFKAGAIVVEPAIRGAHQQDNRHDHEPEAETGGTRVESEERCEDETTADSGRT